MGLLSLSQKRRFYVDATGGNDANSGRSVLDAWQTIAKVNGYTFRARDQILFKRGETWTGTCLTVPRDSLSFIAYGSGAKPIIDGNDAVNCIVANTKNDLTFHNLDLTQGLDFGFSFTTCTNVSVIDCDAHDCGNDNLIFITGCHGCQVRGGEFYNAYERVLTTITAGIEIADGCYDIIVSEVTCRNNTGPLGMGITIHNHGATVMPYNIVVENSTFHTNEEHGIHVLKQDNVADTERNISIINCWTYNNTADGIRIWKSGGAANYPNGVLVDECHSEGNTTYSYYVSGDNHTIQRTVLEGQGLVNGCVGLDFFNNTMYILVAWHYPVYIQNARSDYINVKNCITFRDVVAGGETQIGVDANVVLLNIDIDYNLYYLENETVANVRWNWKGVNKNWADWKTDSGQDSNSPMADQDPLFVNAPADFTLQSGSPAIDAGVDVGLPYLGAAPDCGYAERE